MTDDPRLSPLPTSSRAARRRRALVGAVVAVLLGGAIVGGLAWRGDLAGVLRPAGPATGVPADLPGNDFKTAQGSARVSALETRLALLDDRLSRIDVRASAASGNALRAENLLIAAATRRLVERGAPLGPFDAPLRAQFGALQPAAVQLLSGYALHPVTLDDLDARLNQLAPRLAQVTPQDASWTQVRRGIADLFVVHSDLTPVVSPEERVDRARLLLRADRTQEAVAEVARLPGAQAAAGWIADARRYAAAEQALDAIDAAAIADTPAPRPAAPAMVPPVPTGDPPD